MDVRTAPIKHQRLLQMRRLMTLSISLLLLIISCKSNPEIDVKYSYSLDEGGEVTFKLDDQTPLFTTCLKYYQDDRNEYLYFLNNLKNSIYRFSFYDSVAQVANLEIDGPEGVGIIDGFEVYSPDSIATISPSQFRLSLIVDPFSSPSVKTFKLFKGDKNLFYTPYSNNGNVLVKRQSKIIIPLTPYCDPTKESAFEIGNSQLTLDTNTGEFKAQNIYTELYKQKWSSRYLRYSSTIDKKRRQIVYSFPADSRIMTVGLESSDVSYHEARSDIFNEVSPFDPKKYNNRPQKDHFINEPHYGEIIYDQFRDIYYRFAYSPDYAGIKNGDPRVETKHPSIVVLNSNFEKIAERQLEKYNFIPSMSFVREDGLYISQPKIINLEQGIIEEDILRFVKFELNESN